MAKNKLIAPFLKWVGGKRQLIPEIKNLLPKGILSHPYYEPFIGGGALLFELQPKNATINDYNEELINVYKVIRDNPHELIEDLKKHKNTAEYFYEIRAIDRNPLFINLTDIERASRIIYLNKTCYNGLYRVNNAGEFNSPFGKYKNPNIVNEPVIKAVSKYLNTAKIQIFNGDYQTILKDIPRSSFVYLDPPYHPISQSANFTGYVQGGWDEKDQIRLRNVCNTLNERGIKFLLSNSSSDFIKEIYSDYNIYVVQATRAVNSDSSKRGQVSEFLINNYE
ncbi:DNA adenine methylase [Porphyromonas gingivalis]|nr:DNA adenine methylase [Porphyromonas gingivalis]AAA16106.1 methylase [Porphyromonas gingivalis]ALJ26293.1 DNA adenine methylase Dam [Porphyromonas gingivalis 381]ATR91727.1 modification methylase [Porphyromonas gingivalis]ATS08577.1 modification methylase [Porphyromonas gingivalis]AUR49983.1 modification methylase [Porphyromonas gingivalis ATCC 33277]